MDIQITAQAAAHILNAADQAGIPYTFARAPAVRESRGYAMVLKTQSEDWVGPDLCIGVTISPSGLVSTEFWVTQYISPGGNCD